MDFIPVCEPLLVGNEKKYINEAIDTGWISSAGRFVKEFEKSFEKYCGAQYAVTVINGTAALHLALCALGMEEGDEVILPSFTMMACVVAVRQCGAVPVLVDADKDTWNMNADLIEAKITEKTKGIMPVHIFGNPCNMNKILQLAQKYNLYILGDAAEAHGAKFDGKLVGSIGDIGSFSFFANKNITTGEGGMLTTNNEEIYDQARYYKNLCFHIDGNRNYLHNDIGFNYRMSNLHSAIGLAQVEKADYYKACRQKNAKIYKQQLSQIDGLILQQEEENSETVNWMSGVLLDKDIIKKDRDVIMQELSEKGIGSRQFFQGMHRQRPLKKFIDSFDEFYVSDNLADYRFYLPSGSGLTELQIEYICKTLETILSVEHN